VILDEIGRGTSTYDGVSIAWAVAEHLHDVLGARTLFATHYHELTALAETHPRVSNVSVAAREWQGEVVFLRKLTPGGASRSFGVEVARLAGLPAEVVARARAILATLEGNGAGAEVHGDGPRPVSPGVGISPQLALFQQQRNPPASPPSALADPRLEEILATLRRIDPDDLSPRAAWDLLSELRRKLTESP
jgi:DNA mismatch repair protein MutS